MRTKAPTLIWWITALNVMVMLAYSILIPTYRTPDEPQHVSLSHGVSEGEGYPDWDKGQMNEGVLKSTREVRGAGRSRNLTVEAATQRSVQPSIEALRGDDPNRGINQLTQSPFLYYVATGTAMSVLEDVAGDPIGGYGLETWLYRCMSIAFLAALPFVIWRCSDLLGLPEHLGVAAALFPVANPQLAHLGGSVNNDTLLLLFFWAVTPAVIRIGRGDLRPSTGVLAGVLTGLAMLTKGFGLLLPVWVALALAVALWSGGRMVLRSVLTTGAAYAVAAGVVGGWWWLRNLVRYGDLAPSRFDKIVPTRPDYQPDYVEFFQRWGDRTVRRFWGWFGWFDVAIPRGVVVAVTIVCAASIILALRRRDPVAGLARSTRLLLLAPFVLLVANQFARALASHERAGGWAGLQGRYWFGAMPALSVLVVLGLAQILKHRSRWIGTGMLAFGGIMHGLAVFAIGGFYWGAPNSPLRSRLDAVIAWSPVSGDLLGLGAVAGSVLLLITTVQVVRLAQDQRPSADPIRDAEMEPQAEVIGA